jgi:hypothetical protein
MKWNASEVEYLKIYNKKKTLNEFSKILNRTNNSIRMKLFYLGLSIEIESKSVVQCLHCDKSFKKFNANIKKTPNNFCSKSCAGTYNSLHKKHGTRRSKLEKYLEEQLILLYPELTILFNKKEIIGSELDIYVPDLNLAFELNGIFHYEPIFGKDKLEKIENNDQLKFKACIENKINLCIIDVSNQKGFSIANSKKYLDIIINIINESVNKSN